VPYLEDIRKFGKTALIVAAGTLVLNVLVFTDVPLYMIGRTVPALMLMAIGYTAYTGKVNRRADVVFTYLTFYGIGLFISGVILLFYYGIGTWEYYIVAPAGLILTALGLSVKDGKEVSRSWWNILVVMLILLVLFAVHEIMMALFSYHMDAISTIGRVGREAFLIANAFLLYFTLSSDVQKKFELPFRRA
jgi:hypothetical protein